MRIQHNIPALNAYRSYTQNVAAMKKNLEKLSSGYRINRAGDDAAGLAISEKMRAQITGLEVAQKNAKDGISLVQTAEGAMTEVHDMLNRMYELAEQSANGTYDNETDRAQMQKEIQSLSDEINRIADSSNFNGIKLVDGSLSDGTTVSRTDTFDLPGVGEELGTHSVLHKGASNGATATKFSVDLHNLAFSNELKEKLELKIGNTTFTLEGNGNGAMDTDDLIDEFLDTAGAGSSRFKDSNGTDVVASAVEIDGAMFKVTKGTNGRLMFEQTDSTTISGSMGVTITGTGTEATTAGPSKVDGTAAAAVTVGTGATEGTINFSTLNGTSIKSVADELGISADGNVELQLDTTSNKLQLVIGGTVIGEVATAGVSGGSVSFIGKDANTTTLGSITLANGGGTIGAGSFTPGSTVDSGLRYHVATTDKPAGPNPVTGDYNKSTTVIQSKDDSSATRLASTYFKLTEDMVADGASIKIGDSEYTFKTTKDGTGDVDVSDLDSTSDTYLNDVAERLTLAAKDNTLYTVGHDGNRITVTETVAHATAANYPDDGYDLSTMDGIRNSLGYKSATVTGKSLTLQIGDTSDSYNKLSVSINDCHTDAMGIGDIDISTQDGASAAMKKIKNAINYVSDVRGDLGALQNRLDHTINNLSVMHENIQDAESTIRDVDIAEEMMAYTKNNILVQSSQAMLAQANQLPQGVLQLLQ